MDDDILWVIAIIPLAIFTWWISLRIIAITIMIAKRISLGAILLFSWANKQGFLGFIAYFTAWVFLFPVMLILSLIYGTIEFPDESNNAPQNSSSVDVPQGSTFHDATDYEKRRGF